MQDLYIAPSSQTPEVNFKFSRHQLALRGESYPENAVSFYGPLFQRLKDYFAGTRGVAVSLDIALAYYNSASTKAIYRLVQLCHESALQGTQITVSWHHDPDDDTLHEMGLDLKEEFAMLRFELVEGAGSC